MDLIGYRTEWIDDVLIWKKPIKSMCVPTGGYTENPIHSANMGNIRIPLFPPPVPMPDMFGSGRICLLEGFCANHIDAADFAIPLYK